MVFKAKSNKYKDESVMLFDQNKIDLNYATEIKTFFEKSHVFRRYITLRTLFRCFIGELDRINFKIENIERTIRRLEQEK
jgi:hypothetical protein